MKVPRHWPWLLALIPVAIGLARLRFDVEVLNLLPAEVSGAVPAGGADFKDLTNEALKAAKEAAVSAIERTFLDALMKQCEGNVSRAARESGIHRSHLQKLLAEHGLSVATAAE